MSSVPSFGSDFAGAVRPVPWPEARAQVEALYQPPLRSPATLCKMRQVLRALDALGVKSTADLTSALIARFVASRPDAESPNTTAGLLSYLRALFNHAELEGWVPRSAFRARRRWVRWEDATGARHHPLSDVRKVLALLDRDVSRLTGWPQWRARRTRALVYVLAFTGMRKREALYLRVDDVDFERRVIFIRPRSGNRLKTRKSAQPVPLAGPLAEVLADWLPHLAAPPPVPRVLGPLPGRHGKGLALARPVDTGWLIPNVYRTGPWVGGSPGFDPLDKVKAAGRRAGVQGFTPQSLRHSFATHAESAWGMTSEQIRRILRHTTIRTQEHYRHADVANLNRLAGAIDFGGGRASS